MIKFDCVIDWRSTQYEDVIVMSSHAPFCLPNTLHVSSWTNSAYVYAVFMCVRLTLLGVVIAWCSMPYETACNVTLVRYFAVQMHATFCIVLCVCVCVSLNLMVCLIGVRCSSRS